MPTIERAYFYCVPSEGAAEVPYQHLVVALAEGLIELGVACFSNVDYWPLALEGAPYLLRHDPAVVPEDCELVIVSDDWFRTGNAVPPALTARSHRGCYVALDRDDGMRLRSLAPDFRAFDIVMRTHFNVATRYRDNFTPWAYGLSRRIVDATALAAAATRRWEILANWRHTANPHTVRLAVERSVLPALRRVLPVDEAREPMEAPPDEPRERLWWRETGRRHWPAYYARLGSSAACACFGGFFLTRWPATKASQLSTVLRRIVTRSRARTHLIAQWDSWRLWESFAAGCATVHLDLEAYGCVLPVMPVNWTHYIGFDLDRVSESVERIADDPEGIARIGAAGRAWALEHYAPAPTAQRLLDLVSRS